MRTLVSLCLLSSLALQIPTSSSFKKNETPVSNFADMGNELMKQDTTIHLKAKKQGVETVKLKAPGKTKKANTKKTDTIKVTLVPPKQ